MDTTTRLDHNAATASDDIDVYCRGFSCPQEGWNDPFAKLIVGEFTYGATQAFLTRFKDTLDTCSTGLKPLIGAYQSSDADFDLAWDESFSQAYRIALAGDHARVATVAAALAAHLTSSGFAGSWEVELSEPMQLRWGGWVLPSANRIVVKSDGLSAAITLTGPTSTSSIEMQRTKAGWHTQGCDALPYFGLPYTKIMVLPQHAIYAPLHGSLIANSVPSIAPSQIDAWQAALELVAQHAPIYLPWTARVIRQIFALQETEGIRNGSYEYAFGQVYVSHFLDPIILGETLVHEAAHQYANLISHLSPLHNGNDPNQYYSPPVRTMRSIERILIAYHAFANVLLFYRLCRESGGITEAQFAYHEDRMVQLIGQLENPLRNSPGLTSIGRALADPLLDRTNLQSA